jgi:asparagine synthase (glutamine-hydrolysing)
MVSASGRHVIVYNGEVYNAAELRPELEARGIAFRGHSDSEVILEACEAWGVEATARRLIGMFAFALWDRDARKLRLVRDRLGIKPLYWGRSGNTIFFGSQPKSFAAHPEWRPTVDRDALAAYFRYGCVPAPHSIYRGIRQLEPGTIVAIGDDGGSNVARYWDGADVAEAGAGARLELDDREAVERLESLLADAVRRRLIADVPLGAFLSGGVDSSTVVALMQAASPRPVRTFSIGFGELGFDEAPQAKAVARHLGTDHTELYVDAAAALAVVPRLPEWYDEPFADSSQIPTFLVSELARRHVTVALSGDGGDEVFAGYTRYFLGQGWGRRIGAAPLALRRLAGAAIGALPPSLWDAVARAVPERRRPRHAGARASKLAAVLSERDDAGAYRQLVSQWPEPARLVPGGAEPTLRAAGAARQLDDATERMQLMDLLTYLPNDILTKVDRASMAVGLEARVPLIDHRVVEFAWRLPMRFKLRRGVSKWLLRQVLYRHVPPALIERPKTGFSVPIGAWLKGPLRDWAENLLSPARLKASGVLDPAPVAAAWRDHLAGRRNAEHPLWCVLMFEAWRERYRPSV